MKAIRIDKREILRGGHHVDLLVEYQRRENLTEDQIDAMIEANRIEFGAVFLGKSGELDWEGDASRAFVYTSLDAVISIGGRPRS